jgi:hypothetical protein
MAAERELGRWMVHGALMGYAIPFAWIASLICFWSIPFLEGAAELWTVVQLLTLGLLLYTFSGAGVLAAVVGIGCGYACSCLPVSLPLWCRRTGLVFLVHLAFFLIYKTRLLDRIITFPGAM